MKNKLIILLPLFLLIILPYKTNALTVSELRMYYFNDLGQSLSTNTTQTQNWSGYNVKYINHAFGGGSFSDIPNLLYAFMPSGLGCSGDSCSITGSFMNYVPYGVTSLNYSLDIQIEIGGVYSKCSITNSSIHDTYFEKYDFICFGSNFNQGFNLVVDNMSIYSDKFTYFGLAYETLQIKDNISYGDIINNQTQNTQVIINNQNNNQQQTNNKLNDLNNTMNSDEAPSNNDVSNKTSEWASKNASAAPISNMVLMPITLLNAYTTGMSTTCSPYNLGNLYGTDIVLPCINVSNYFGSTLWGVIDVLFSGFMIYAIGKKFVKIFNDFTNLRDNQVDELYGGGK